MKKQIYKFRAECLNDVMEFMGKASFLYDIKIERQSLFPDVVVEIITNVDISVIVDVFKNIQDSHVMIETIQPKNTYTCERKL